MKALHTLILVAALTLAATFNAQAAPVNIESWMPSDVISSPLGSSLTEVTYALAAKDVANTYSQGTAVEGNYAVTYETSANNHTVQMTFDTHSKLDAVSTWYTAADASKATDIFTSLMNRIEKQGGQRVDMGSVNLNDGSVSYSVRYGADDVRTVTVSRNANESNVIWVVVSR